MGRVVGGAGGEKEGLGTQCAGRQEGTTVSVRGSRDQLGHQVCSQPVCLLCCPQRDSMHCESTHCVSAHCESANCESTHCVSAHCGTARCESARCESVRCESAYCESVHCTMTPSARGDKSVYLLCMLHTHLHNRAAWWLAEGNGLVALLAAQGRLVSKHGACLSAPGPQGTTFPLPFVSL